MTLKETIKDILKDVNCYLPDDKLEAWTNVILSAIEQDKDKETFKMMDGMYKAEFNKKFDNVLETVASL